MNAVSLNKTKGMFYKSFLSGLAVAQEILVTSNSISPHKSANHCDLHKDGGWVVPEGGALPKNM